MKADVIIFVLMALFGEVPQPEVDRVCEEREVAPRFLLSLVMTKAKMLQMMVHGGCSEFAQLPNCTTSGGLSWSPLGKALAPDELPPHLSTVLLS